jgi:hypothetical protein
MQVGPLQNQRLARPAVSQFQSQSFRGTEWVGIWVGRILPSWSALSVKLDSLEWANPFGPLNIP